MRFNCGWYVIYTKPNHEKRVTSQMKENAISFFMPTRKSFRVWHDRKKIIQVPLFPGYIFVYLKNMEDYLNGLNSNGALHYVRFGKEVAKVPESVIANLEIVVNNCKNTSVYSECLVSGSQVIIKSGALAGLECEIIQQKNQRKLLVRVNILNRYVLADISQELIA